jgi:hypothetical protein
METRVRSVALLAGVLLFAGAVAWMNWVRYASLRATWPLDLGAFHNQAFNLAQGRDLSYVFVPCWFRKDDHEGPSVYRSNHFSPLRLLLLPQLYRLRPQITTLMLLQGLLVGVGAFALHGLAVTRARRPGLGLLLAGSFLVHPAILHVAFNDYRDIALGIGPALVALWAHATGRTRAFVAAALLMLAARSEYTVLLAGFGVLNWRIAPAELRRSARFLLLPLLLAVVWGLVSHAYYLSFYGASWPLLGYSAERPPLELLTALGERLLPFFRTMLLPAVIGLGTPEVFLAALPFVALAQAVRWPGFPHHHLQHLSPAMVAVFWAFAVTLVRLWPQRSALRRALGTGLALAAAASFLPFAGSALRVYPPTGVGRHARLSALADALPPDATVVVPNELLARFSRHTRVLTHEMLPLGPRATAEEQRAAAAGVIALADLVVLERRSELSLAAQQAGLFTEERVGRYRVFRRRPDALRPPDPDLELQRVLLWDRLPERRRRGATLRASGSAEVR